jgi:hypothetical protein
MQGILSQLGNCDRCALIMARGWSHVWNASDSSAGAARGTSQSFFVPAAWRPCPDTSYSASAPPSSQPHASSWWLSAPAASEQRTNKTSSMPPPLAMSWPSSAAASASVSAAATVVANLFPATAVVGGDAAAAAADGARRITQVDAATGRMNGSIASASGPGRCVSIFLDKNRCHMGISEVKNSRQKGRNGRRTERRLLLPRPGRDLI